MINSDRFSWIFLFQFKHYRFEIFCCTSSDITFVDCNWTRWQNDSDVKMILPKPRIKSYGEGGVGDVVGFRDFRVKWEGKNMLVQYNVCNTNSSGSPGCHYPCFPKLDQEKLSSSDGSSGGKKQFRFRVNTFAIIIKTIKDLRGFNHFMVYTNQIPEKLIYNLFSFLSVLWIERDLFKV